MLEKTLENPLDCKKIQPVHPKGDQSWIFIGRTDVEAETPILWPPDVKNWLIWKDTDAGKDWRQEEKDTTEFEIVGWHRWLNGHEFEQSSGVGDGQGSLVCCSPRGRKELDTTERPNWTEGRCCPLLKWGLILCIFVGLPLSWIEIVLVFHLVFELFPGAYQFDSFMPCLLQAHNEASNHVIMGCLSRSPCLIIPFGIFLGDSCDPYGLSVVSMCCAFHQHVPERLAILVPSLQGEKWRRYLNSFK